MAKVPTLRLSLILSMKRYSLGDVFERIRKGKVIFNASNSACTPTLKTSGFKDVFYCVLHSIKLIHFTKTLKRLQ